MTDEVFKELHKDNLCTYFILPLLKLNKFRFLAESNFVNSYLSIDGNYIFVEVLEVLFIEHNLMLHPNFEGLYTNEDTYFIKYKIPNKYKQDVTKFRLGKFSKLSDTVKGVIYKHSGLAYKHLNDSGSIMTDIRLLALEKSQMVRELWEDYFDVDLSDVPDLELLSIPENKSYKYDQDLIPMGITEMSE